MWQRLPIPDELHGMVWHYNQDQRTHPKHQHVDWEINVVLKGSGSYLIGSRRVEIGRGSVIWLLPHQEHVLVEPSADLEMWVVVFSPILFKRWHKDPVVGPVLSVRRAEFHPKQISRTETVWLHALASDLQKQLTQVTAFNAGLNYFFGRAWQVYSLADTLPNSDEVHPAVERAVRRLNQKDDDLIGVEFARACGLSRTRLSRLFKDQMKVSLTTYRNQCRLQRFQTIYQNGKRLTLLEAALQAGFGSYAQFHRVYREITGNTPRDKLRGSVLDI